MANDIPLSILRTDILPEALTEEQARVIASHHYSVATQKTVQDPSRTPANAKNIFQVMALVKDAIEHYEDRTGTIERAQVTVVYDEPDAPIEYETISILLTRREPGAFSQGAPFEGRVKNLRPALREEKVDEEEPGYRRAILGYFHDNLIRLTCWANTNKEANARMLWLEEVMEQYIWYFRTSGVHRFLYYNHDPAIVKTTSNNRLYGRAIDYFVRTETLRVVKQKELEQIYLRYAFRRDENL